MSVYDDSPARAQVALTAEEVDDLLLTDGSFFTKDPRRVRHLLTRMRASFVYHVEQLRNLQRDIEHMHAAARTRGTPMSAALDALRQLTLDEQRQLFDIRAQTLVDAVETARGDAARARVAASSEANRVRFALARVLGDPDVPAEIRSKIELSLHLLPEAEQTTPANDDVLAQPVEGGFVVPPRAEGTALSDALFGADDDPASA